MCTISYCTDSSAAAIDYTSEIGGMLKLNVDGRVDVVIFSTPALAFLKAQKKKMLGSRRRLLNQFPTNGNTTEVAMHLGAGQKTSNSIDICISRTVFQAIFAEIAL